GRRQGMAERGRVLLQRHPQTIEIWIDDPSEEVAVLLIIGETFQSHVTLDTNVSMSRRRRVERDRAARRRTDPFYSKARSYQRVVEVNLKVGSLQNLAAEWERDGYTVADMAEYGFL